MYIHVYEIEKLVLLASGDLKTKGYHGPRLGLTMSTTIKLLPHRKNILKLFFINLNPHKPIFHLVPPVPIFHLVPSCSCLPPVHLASQTHLNLCSLTRSYQILYKLMVSYKSYCVNIMTNLKTIFPT